MTTETTADAQLEAFDTQSWRPWIVCFSAALFFLYEFIQMHMFSAISPDLMRDFSLNAGQLGLLSTSYLIADTVFLLPAGLILDRYPTRNVVIAAMVACVVSTAGFALTSSALMAGILHFITGIGNAFCFLACVLLVSRWFPPRRQALIIGLVVTMAFIGGAIAQTPMALLAKSFGWRNALLIDALLGIGILMIIWRYVRDYPKEQEEQRAKEHQELQHTSFMHSLKIAAANPRNWLCGLYISFLNLPIMVIDALWGGLYLTEVHHISMTRATIITTMIFIGSIIGCPLAGWWSDTIGQRRMPMIVGGAFSLITMAAIMFMPHSGFNTLLVLFFALGFFTSTQVIGYPTVIESNPESMTGTATGLASVIIMGGAAIAQPMFGWLMDISWSGKLMNNVPVYSSSDFHNAMLMFPIAFIIALIAIAVVKDPLKKS